MSKEMIKSARFNYMKVVLETCEQGTQPRSRFLKETWLVMPGSDVTRCWPSVLELFSVPVVVPGLGE